jgi:hypothetical protein
MVLDLDVQEYGVLKFDFLELIKFMDNFLDEFIAIALLVFIFTFN